MNGRLDVVIELIRQVHDDVGDSFVIQFRGNGDVPIAVGHGFDIVAVHRHGVLRRS